MFTGLRTGDASLIARVIERASLKTDPLVCSTRIMQPVAAEASDEKSPWQESERDSRVAFFAGSPFWADFTGNPMGFPAQIPPNKFLRAPSLHRAKEPLEALRRQGASPAGRCATPSGLRCACSAGTHTCCSCSPRETEKRPTEEDQVTPPCSL